MSCHLRTSDSAIQLAGRGRRTAFMRGRLLVTLLAIVAPDAWSACSVNTSGVNFGNYDPFGRSNLDGAGNVSVTCDLGVTYTIALSSGNGAYAARVMSSGAYSLYYNLYANASRILVWGDGSGGTVTVSDSGAETATNKTIYARIPAAQNAHVGNYSDNVIVTVTF